MLLETHIGLVPGRGRRETCEAEYVATAYMARGITGKWLVATSSYITNKKERIMEYTEQQIAEMQHEQELLLEQEKDTLLKAAITLEACQSRLPIEVMLKLNKILAKQGYMLVGINHIGSSYLVDMYNRGIN